MKVAVCCIAKNENNYIREWVAFYKALSFDGIYVYDNISSDGTSECLISLDNLGLINRIYWPRKKKIPPQREAYCHFLENAAKNYDYVLFCDVDEFLSVKNQSVKSFLASAEEKFGNVGAIAIPWLMFGSSGEEKFRDGLVIERFTKCRKGPNKEVKSFVKPEKAFNMRTHICDLMDGFYLDNCLEIASWSQKRPIDLEIPKMGSASIHHYYTKSREEWIARRSGEKADRAQPEYRNIDEFDKYHNLEVVNEDLKGMVPIVRRWLDFIYLQETNKKASLSNVSVIRCDGGWLFVSFDSDIEEPVVRLDLNHEKEFFVRPNKYKNSFVASLKIKWKEIDVSFFNISIVGGQDVITVEKKSFPNSIETLQRTLAFMPSSEENIFEFFLKSSKTYDGLKEVCSYSYPRFDKFVAEGNVLNSIKLFINGKISRDDFLSELSKLNGGNVKDIKMKAEKYGCEFLVSYLNASEKIDLKND